MTVEKIKQWSVGKKLAFVTAAIYGVVSVLVAAVLYFIINNAADHSAAIPLVIGVMLGGFCLIVALMLILKKNIQSERRKEQLVDIINDLTFMSIIWDKSFEFIKVNEEFTRRTGYTEEDLHNPDILKRVLPNEAFSEDVQNIINCCEDEFCIQGKNGKVYVIWNTSVVDNGVAGFADIAKGRSPRYIMMSIGADITENHHMRQELISYSDKLKDSERKYALSTELSDIGLILKESGSSRFYVSEQLCEMMGLALTVDYLEAEDLRGAFHPKDKVVFDTFASGMKNTKDGLESNEIHSVDFRAMSADGKYHWYNIRYRAYSGPDSSGVGGAVMDITTDKEKDLRIERMAYIDETTQIYNRNKFMLLGREILECTRGDKNIDYWVIVIDIDSFHIINDTCGYSTGNFLLKEIASVLLSNITEGGFTARIGGDNFAFIIRADDNDEMPVKLMKRIQRDIANISGSGLENQNVTCSAGYCRISDGEADDFAKVLDRAEFALSLSDGTRSSVIRFDNRAHDAIIAGNEIEKELIRAVDSSEMVLYYQPKINLETGRIMGMEALIRWVKPDGTVVLPNEFIPIAENSMLITKISKFVLHEACRQNKEWQEMGLGPFTVSVNLTAIDFYQTNVTENIRSALSETGLSSEWLDVELTESLALKDIDHAVDQMNEIKELGVKLSMDDFGTGYSSLSYIQILPITILKLDRSFIMYLEEDDISREIVSAVIRIAKSKKIETIAEGVETLAQAEILKQSGCDHAQGFFFGKPMPANQFEVFMRSRQTNARVLR